MNEWWSQHASVLIGAIGGGGGGALAGIFGGLMGYLAPRGIGRTPMLGAHAALITCGVVALITGIVALAAGQPYHVYFPLLLGGGIVTIVMGSLFPVARLRYRQAEQRKFDAEQFRRS